MGGMSDLFIRKISVSKVAMLEDSKLSAWGREDGGVKGRERGVERKGRFRKV